MKKERGSRLRVSSYKSRNKTAFCQNFCTGAVRGRGVRGRGTMIGCGDAAESKRVRALCFWEWGKARTRANANGLERVRFVRF